MKTWEIILGVIICGLLFGFVNFSVTDLKHMLWPGPLLAIGGVAALCLAALAIRMIVGGAFIIPAKLAKWAVRDRAH